MTDPRLDLDQTHADVLSRLLAAPGDRDCPFRTPALATVGAHGGAEARLVVLREVHQDPLRLIFHTDSASAKLGEIAHAPQGTLLFWDQEIALQVRVRARLTARRGTSEEWSRIPDGARRAYGGTPAPGQPITSPVEHDATPTRERHMILTAQAVEIETLRINHVPHARALFRARDDFRGQWLAP